MSRLRVAQIGTRHGHAAGKWQALRKHADVDAVGIWEPDAERRSAARAGNRFPDAHWFESLDEALTAPGITAVAVEGRNHESLAMARAAVDAGKHLWFDKPAGDDWPAFVELMAQAGARERYIQMGYMFRYSPGFRTIADWARSGLLGDVFGIRAHMSTGVDLTERTEQSRHRGGILYDLGGHMIDQIVWLLGRPTRVSSVQRNDATPELPTYVDNSLATFEFPHALVTLEIAAMEPRPAARRFEVYGTRGSAILEPFDPVRTIRLVLEQPAGDFAAGEHLQQLEPMDRQALYDREIEAFVGVLGRGQPPDRSPDHELLVQETLLRATGRIGDAGAVDRPA